VLARAVLADVRDDLRLDTRVDPPAKSSSNPTNTFSSARAPSIADTPPAREKIINVLDGQVSHRASIRWPAASRPATGEDRRLEAGQPRSMIEGATVDAYGDDEQLTGLFTMIEEHLAVPFTTTVLGVKVTVRKVDLTADTNRRGLHPGHTGQGIDLSCRYRHG
jgi:hypothetical protein